MSGTEKEIQHATSWERIGTGNLPHPEGADMDLIWPASLAYETFCCSSLRPLPPIATPEEARVFHWEGEGGGGKRKAEEQGWETEKLSSGNLFIMDGNLFIITVDWMFHLLKWDCSSGHPRWPDYLKSAVWSPFEEWGRNGLSAGLKDKCWKRKGSCFLFHAVEFSW